jgi:hypothetical protein
MPPRSAITALSLGALAAISVAVSSPAAASVSLATAPSGCTFGVNGPPATRGGVACNHGTGYYVRVRCTDELRGSSVWINGPRVNAVHVSQVTCPKLGGVQFIIETPYLRNMKVLY